MGVCPGTMRDPGPGQSRYLNPAGQQIPTYRDRNPAQSRYGCPRGTSGTGQRNRGTVPSRSLPISTKDLIEAQLLS